MNLEEFERTLPPEQRWENLTLANDFMFGCVMRNPELCTEMIRRILPDMDIGRIEFTQPQRSEKQSLDTRGVRFDVYAKSDNRKIFDCEVQTSDKKDLPRRTRAYHIMMGLEALEKHALTVTGTYNDMPDEFVIFICMFDPFGLGRHIYTFSNACQEADGLQLNDGAVTIFLNAHGKSDDINGELKAFLDFMLGKGSDDPFIVRLSEQMSIAKLDAKWRRTYMLQMLHEREVRYEAIIAGRNEGREEGLKEGLIEGRMEGLKEGLIEGREEGHKEGLIEGRSEMLSTMIDLMRSNGISAEQIDTIINAAKKLS